MQAKDQQFVSWKEQSITHIWKANSLFFNGRLFINNLEGMIGMEWEIWWSIEIKTNTVKHTYNEVIYFVIGVIRYICQVYNM